MSEIEHARHRVKQPPHAGGLGTVCSRLGHPSQDRPRFSIETADKREIQIQKLIAISAMKIDRGHSPRLANRLRTSGHRHVVEMRNALGIVEVCNKELAAPESPVASVAE